ncbi:hypothetical protein [Chryseobacterium rhizosphaerae]|nr:hypothetical protein [Chryseobacterium rhizosphaerae]MDC8100844.1 hypothetical protein [Chryseobacterium rhizosphaerae]MDR6544937.1 hypothetical protein [Chryseobacterium rhizosphaerae]GEN65728.1 hypothetical protein CRH01_02960 [Chryseobacterium rhizosphaerae]
MDITAILQKAIYANMNWKHSIFFSVIETLSHHYITDIEIDSEKIYVLSTENKIIGYICLNYPLIFIENNYASQVDNILSAFDSIQYIRVKTLHDQYLSIDPDIYNTCFDYMENLTSFSAEDFYFCNVT